MLTQEACKGDFIGFTFNGHHSSEFKIVRTSDGSRFNEDLLPPISDLSAAVPGRDGAYYFGSLYGPKQFTIPFAYDGLTELDLEKLRRWLDCRELTDLIFDERPYKVYKAKVESSATAQYICFEENIADSGETFYERHYKGEGSISFICYTPFARGRWKFLTDVPSTIDATMWKDASRIPTNNVVIGTQIFDTAIDTSTAGNSNFKVYLSNPSQMDLDFSFAIPIINSASNQLTMYLTEKPDSELKIDLSNLFQANKQTYVIYDSKRHLLLEAEADSNSTGTYHYTGVLFNKQVISGDFFQIPYNTIIEDTKHDNKLYGATLILEFTSGSQVSKEPFDFNYTYLYY